MFLNLDLDAGHFVLSLLGLLLGLGGHHLGVLEVRSQLVVPRLHLLDLSLLLCLVRLLLFLELIELGAVDFNKANVRSMSAWSGGGSTYINSLNLWLVRLGSACSTVVVFER